MDNQLSELSEEERYRKKQLLVRPLVEALFAWLKKVRDEKMVPEGGKTMKGVNYYLNHEKQFLEFLNHGNVPLDNNATESALRNFCTHKHTWSKSQCLSLQYCRNRKSKWTQSISVSGVPADRNDGT